MLLYGQNERGIFTLFILLLPGLTSAQSIISGTVTDETGEPLIGANVLIESLVIGASTDLDGHIHFKSLPKVSDKHWS